MPMWRRIATDRDPNEAARVPPLDQRLPSQAAARAIPRRKPTERVSIHFCPHAAGEPSGEWYNCKDDPRAQYEEV